MKQLAGLDLLDPSKYHENHPAQIYSHFLNQDEITKLKQGDTIMLPSRQLTNTNSTFYLFNQYLYMKDRIMNLLDKRRRIFPNPKNDKGGVIVTGMPGIGRMSSIIFI